MARAGHRRPSRCGAPSDVGFYVRREGVDQGAAGTKARNVGADASGVKAASPRKTWSEVRRLAVTSQTGRLRSTLPFLRILLNLLPGRLAQLVERLLYTQDVGGSSPSPPTTPILLIFLSDVRGRSLSRSRRVREALPDPSRSRYGCACFRVDRSLSSPLWSGPASA